MANGDLDLIRPPRGFFFARSRGGSELPSLIRGLGLREIARVDVAIYEMSTKTANSGGWENLSRPKLDENVDVVAHLGCGNWRAMAGSRFIALGLRDAYAPLCRGDAFVYISVTQIRELKL